MPSPHADHVLEQLDAQREWGFLCDVLVSIGDTQFRAHRAVLAACSAFFRMLFIQTDCRGQQSVDLSHTGLSATSFDRVLQFMYQGHVSATDSLDLEELKSSMQQLQMYFIPETLEELNRVQAPNSGTKLMFGVRMFPAKPGPETRAGPETRLGPETRAGPETRLGPETSSSTGNR
ncbi:zinc finger and BTB domain-containing protein 1-like [Eucyclogobius newberryi]|uniref:zinc finger and BTB domain-containing protein 1-like n=1 Tax=Eucyclogobius newberryi TaxID=166745 RepID=UPI003B5B659E